MFSRISAGEYGLGRFLLGARARLTNFRNANQFFHEVSKLLGSTLLVQILSVVTGLLIVRSLEIEEYALYTLGNALFSVGSVLATMSVPSAVVYLLSQPGSAHAPSAFFEGKRVANRLAIGAAIVVVGGAWLYRSQFGEGSLAIALLGVGATWLGSRVHLRRGAAFALRKVGSVARAEITSALVRFTSACVVIVTPFATARGILLLAVNLVGLLVLMLSLRLPVEHGSPNPQTRKAILQFITPLVPEHIYFIVRGQLLFFLLAIFGDAVSIGEFGALTRLGMIVAILSVLNTGIFQPFVARHGNWRDYVRRSLLVLCFWIALSCVFLVSASIYPEMWMSILGSRYQSLQYLVSTLMFVTCVSLIADTLYTVVLASGRPGPLSLAIPVGIAVQAVYVGLVGVSNVSQALGLSLVSALADLAVRGAVLVATCRRMHKRETNSAAT